MEALIEEGMGRTYLCTGLKGVDKLLGEADGCFAAGEEEKVSGEVFWDGN